ncbi:MAG TPA: DinB family protein [Terriglobales bacterium]|nr:DinB family protein [Terriglobales bacterium]
MSRTQKALTLLVVLIISGLAAAQTAAPAPTGVKAEITQQLQALEKQAVSLAEAIPAEKYSWRPAPGVRSIGEVFLHIAGGNYLFFGALGVKPPAGLDMDKLETSTTDKAKIIEILKQSFDASRQQLSATTDADMDKMAKLFGRERTTRALLVQDAVHLSEHIGQSIAYARSVGVTPPWTAAREAAQKESQRKSSEKPK